MSVQQLTLVQAHGKVVAAGVSLEEYMERYAADRCEYVEGMVIRVAANEIAHIRIEHYLYNLLDEFFGRRPIGQVIAQPFVMRLEEFPNRRREPDLLIVMKDNPSEIKGSYIDGPADIVIEIVSEESIERDRGEKFAEYETGRVGEYWLLDYLREEAQFYRRINDRFVVQTLDANQQYRTPLLPDFILDVATLWRDPLPKPSDVGRMVAAMLDK